MKTENKQIKGLPESEITQVIRLEDYIEKHPEDDAKSRELIIKYAVRVNRNWLNFMIVKKIR